MKADAKARQSRDKSRGKSDASHASHASNDVAAKAATGNGASSVLGFLATPGAPLRTPKGMGDLLPPEANARRSLTRVVLKTFELSGYDLITTPMFEHAAVVERGNDSFDPRDLLRFVEPESGEVAVLRPDITPQIARLVATRLANHPAPFRLCYEGRVLRRRRGRARSHQQITQAGVECVGLAGPEADTEVLSLAERACLDAGLTDFRIELSHVTIAQSLLDQLPEGARVPVSDALARKDHASLASVLESVHVNGELASRLQALTEHYGDLDVLDLAERKLRWPAAQAALRNLREIVERLARLGDTKRLCVDLSDARGSSYYTGISFNLLAAGPGESIGAGGRYDQLLARFGHDRPATGFAFDLENLQWALRAAGQSSSAPAMFRVALAGGDEAQRNKLASALRARDVIVATLPNHNGHDDRASCLAFARAWGYDATLVLRPNMARLVRANDASEKAVKAEAAAIVALKDWAQAVG